ncbi:MAG TPA: helix-turn-helix domain-containing protein [Ktedonobacterales bacterium]
MTPWYARFMASTRGRLLSLLRRRAHTVEELAQGLGLTDNAVRAHLATLERDGLVEQCGVRRAGGVGKPAYAYALAPAAEQLFPRPYAAVLDETLAALAERMPPAEVEALLRESGRRLAQDYPAGAGDTRERLGAAVAALNNLGGLAEVDESGGAPEIHSYSCALAALVPGHAEVCALAEAFTSEVAGVALREECERGATPHCRFRLAESATTSAGE